MSTTTDHIASQDAQASIFGRILVGIDDSPESLEAARQAVALAGGPITLVAAYDPTDALVGGAMPPAPAYLDEESIREEVQEALQLACQEVSPVEPVTKIGRGRAWQVLIDEIRAGYHTLVAVGSHGRGRARGILIGSTATELIHKAPCSVLVARQPLTQFPQLIVAAVDQSPQAAVADAVAGSLADRFDARFKRFESVPDPVTELVRVSGEADLIVIGSRGLHGIKALGSVSEQVAHEAACSVLIVR